MILFLSHGERGYAALAAAVARQTCPDVTIIAGELGSRHQYGPSKMEMELGIHYPDLPIIYPSHATESMINGADHVFYMNDEDKIRLERIMAKVEPPKFNIIIDQGVPTLLDGWSEKNIYELIVNATREKMEGLCSG